MASKKKPTEQTGTKKRLKAADLKNLKGGAASFHEKRTSTDTLVRTPKDKKNK